MHRLGSRLDSPSVDFLFPRLRHRMVLLIAVAAVLAPPFFASSQEPNFAAKSVQSESKPDPVDIEIAKKENLLEWSGNALGWKYSLVFFFMAIFLVGILTFNVISIRRESLCPIELLEAVDLCIAENKLDAAAELVRASDSFLGRIVASGLGKLEKGHDKAIEAMQVTGERETMVAEHRLGYLALLGNIAPMVGLLGTVEGMVVSFTVIAHRTQTPPPSELASGISMALVTTLCGLYIAIPAIAAYNLLRNKFQRLVLEVGNVSEELLEKFEQSVRD